MFHYLKPKNLPETLMLLNDEQTRYPILAGGTDLLVQWKMTSKKPTGILDIGRLEELATIVEAGDVVEIGPLVTHSIIINSKIIARCCPALADACKTVGAVQIQNRGTIGGNIVTASPAGDTPPALMAFDAMLELSCLGGTRKIPIREFYISYRKTALRPNEMLSKIIIPKQRADERSAFYKVGTRRAQAISKVVFCARSRIMAPSPQGGEGGGEGGLVIKDIAIALGSVAPTVIRAPDTENFLKGKRINESIIEEAGRKLSKEVLPIDDIRSTADYRRFVSGNLLVRYLSDSSPL